MSVEDRIIRLERMISRSRRISLIKDIIYLIILIGIVLYGYSLYKSVGEISIEASGAPKVWFKAPTVLLIDQEVVVHNPGVEASAKLVYYRVYIEGEYVGDGFIPYLVIPTGDSRHKLHLEVDLSRLSCGLAKAIESGRNITVSIAGYMMVDLKTWGGITWKTITLPFNTTPAVVSLPELPGEARAFLKLYTYVCTHSEDLINILDLLKPKIGLQGATPEPVTGNVNLTVLVDAYKTGLASYEVDVVVKNTGGSPVTVYEVSVDGRRIYYSGEGTILVPGESMRVSGEVTLIPLTDKLHVTVKTDKGPYIEVID